MAEPADYPAEVPNVPCGVCLHALTATCPSVGLPCEREEADSGNDGPDDHDLGELLADRETLRALREQLIDARIALGMVARAVGPSVKKARSTQSWVNLPLYAAREVLRVDRLLNEDRRG